MSAIKTAAMTVMKTLVEHAPERFLPGGTPDPLLRQKHGLIGQPVSRLDGPLKVRGAAPFAAEFPLDGMVFAALAYSTIARGHIATLDTAAAEAAPGVVLVMTHKNAPKLGKPPIFMTSPKAASIDDIPVLQDTEIHWNGQPIAILLAETQEQADYAKSLLRVTYKEEPATTVFDEAKKHPHAQDFAGQPLEQTIGKPEEALAGSPYKVDNLYTTPRHSHNAIELHAVTLAWRGTEGDKDEELFLHDASQCVDYVAWSLAQVLGIEEKQVHVTSPFVGGGFGGKTMGQHHILAAAAARVAGRPVRLVLSREGVYRIVGGRTVTEQRVAISAQEDGEFTAIVHTGVSAMSRHNQLPEAFITPAKCLYAAGAFRLSVKVAEMDMLANSFMRAPGESVGSFALESAIDELAEKLGMDPIELRLRNEPQKDPTKGTPFSSRHLVEAYRVGAERFGWKDRHPTPGSRREGEWLIGMGCATATYPYQRMPGGAARITLSQEGIATVAVAAHEMGMGTATVQTQVIADRMGLAMECVRFEYGDSSLPGVILAGGSQQTAAIGAAVEAAHQALVKELIHLAGKVSPLAGLKPEEVTASEGRLCKLDEPARCDSYAAILRRAGRQEVVVEAEAPPPLELMHWSMHSYGAQFCEARVNAVTGETRISRFLGSFDCGRILNAKTASSQFRGGIIMGLGLALMEETEFDERKGRILNPSLAEYHVPVHMDVPAIEILYTDIPDPHTPMGAHGVGEIGITGTAAAVANAIYNACGRRIRDLPITLDKLLA